MDGSAWLWCQLVALGITLIAFGVLYCTRGFGCSHHLLAPGWRRTMACFGRIRPYAPEEVVVQVNNDGNVAAVVHGHAVAVLDFKAEHAWSTYNC